MENPLHVKIVLSDEEMAKFNEVVSVQADSILYFNPTTDMVIKTPRQWFINYN